MAQKQLRKPNAAKGEELQELPHDSHKGDALKSEIDDLLDEIDGLLEENAKEFVESYKQKAGQ